MKVMEDGTRVPVREEGRPTVVVGVDGSPGSRAALVDAMRSASLRGARLHVVAVYEPPEWRLGPTPGCPSRAGPRSRPRCSPRSARWSPTSPTSSAGSTCGVPRSMSSRFPAMPPRSWSTRPRVPTSWSWATAAVVRSPARCSARSGSAACSTRPAPCGSCPRLRHAAGRLLIVGTFDPARHLREGRCWRATDVVAFTLVGPGPSPRTRRAAGEGACRDHGVPGG